MRISPHIVSSTGNLRGLSLHKYFPHGLGYVIPTQARIRLVSNPLSQQHVGEKPDGELMALGKSKMKAENHSIGLLTNQLFAVTPRPKLLVESSTSSFHILSCLASVADCIFQTFFYSNIFQRPKVPGEMVQTKSFRQPGQFPCS